MLSLARREGEAWAGLGTIPRPLRIDYFSAGDGKPVLIFLHGGYWQLRSKNDFAFLAEPLLGSGIRYPQRRS